MLNDEWTLKDSLGHQELVNNLIQNISEIKPPFTLGIYGGWGSGKTSLMKQVFYRIGGKTKSFLFPFDSNVEKEEITFENQQIINQITTELNYEAIWFNPWKHEIESNPVLGLLHEIREHFNLYTKSSAEAKKLASVSVRTGIDILTSTIKEFTKIDLHTSNIEKYGEKYENNNFETKSTSQNFRIIFESSIKKLIGKDKKLVIFIDDLDRCTDSKVIKLLEGIKLYLSTSNCIFIFGMDQNNVLRALKNNNIHEEYLDKLFQSIIRIPMSKKYEKFFTETIVGDFFNNDLNTPEKKSDFITLLMSILEKNPRKIKNFMNSMRFYWKMKKTDLDIEIFVLFHYLRINYEDIFNILERDSTLLANLINVCKNESPNCSIEYFFIERLKNLISNEIVVIENSTGQNYETKKLDKDDIISIQNMKLKFKTLDNFKNIFSVKVTTLINVEDYLGVLEND